MLVGRNKKKKIIILQYEGYNIYYLSVIYNFWNQYFKIFANKNISSYH